MRSSPLATDLALALDPVQLAERVGISPEPWQAEVLRSPHKRLLLCCARQAGKTTITAVLALHTALYEPGALVLLLSPSMRQSLELFRKITAYFRVLGRPVSVESETSQTLDLGNGSRIVALPGTEQTTRGFSGCRLMIFDEAARVEDEIYLSSRPMLHPRRGRLVLLSTPFGNRGFFHDCWRDESWERFHVPAARSARLDADFIAEQRRALGEWWGRQELDAEFLDAQTTAFASAYIESAFDPHLQPMGVLSDAWRTE